MTTFDDFGEYCIEIFEKATKDYHTYDDTARAAAPPFLPGSLDYLLYMMNWIDNVQWHLEDAIRDAELDSVVALQCKRRIDAANQERACIVEAIDDNFVELFLDSKPWTFARLNTESPALAIDRLSILSLKIYHMKIESLRAMRGAQAVRCASELKLLAAQRTDLSKAIDALLLGISRGEIMMKVYRRVKNE